MKVINQKSNLLITTKDICQTQGSELTRKGTSKYLKIFYYTEKLFSIIFSLENSETVESQRSIEPNNSGGLFTVLKDSQEERRQSVILLNSFLFTNIRGRSGA